MVRVDADFSATPFKAKISSAEQLRVHTMLAIGGRDGEAESENGGRTFSRGSKSTRFK